MKCLLMTMEKVYIIIYVPYITIILRGGYWETTKEGKFWRKPGYIGFRSANAHHRVDLKKVQTL